MVDPGWIFGSVGFVFGAVGFIRGRRMDQRMQRMEGLLAARSVEHPEAVAQRVAQAQGEVHVPVPFPDELLPRTEEGMADRGPAEEEMPRLPDRPGIDRRELQRRLAELPEQRAALLQLWAEGATPSELAAAFGVKEAKVAEWLAQARRELLWAWPERAEGRDPDSGD
jgi:hypothetical protein